MQLRPDQLDKHLEKTLAPIYLVSGDEPLQALEAADAIRAHARARGYTEREVLHVESGFDWNRLLAAGASLSLFGDRRLLDLRLPSGKPGEAGAKALRAYAERPPEDTVLLITAGKLESAARRSAWVRALDGAGVVLFLWPVDAARLAAWVRTRMQRRGLRPTAEAVTLLAQRVEGNLLACAQEIDKLHLLHGPGPVDADAVAAGVADSARYDVFTLMDAALAGEAARSHRILQGLRAEGVDPVLVVWALAREFRGLAVMARSLAATGSVPRVLAEHKVWDSRKAAVGKALTRIPRVHPWQDWLRRCARVDRIIKGRAPGSAWDELVQLVLELSGARTGLPAEA